MNNCLPGDTAQPWRELTAFSWDPRLIPGTYSVPHSHLELQLGRGGIWYLLRPTPSMHMIHRHTYTGICMYKNIYAAVKIILQCKEFFGSLLHYLNYLSLPNKYKKYDRKSSGKRPLTVAVLESCRSKHFR